MILRNLPFSQRLVLLFDKYMDKTGHLVFYGYKTRSSIKYLTGKVKNLRPLIDVDSLMYYSARKTFAQLANELMIKDSIIEYCLGDAVSDTGKTLSFYIKVNKAMADRAIRLVLDAVASDEPMSQIIARTR